MTNSANTLYNRVGNLFMEAVVDKASWRELKARAKKAQAKAQKALDAGPNAPNQQGKHQ